MSEVQNMDNDSKNEEEVDEYKVVGEATDDEVFFLEWARESVKRTCPQLNELLQKLITLIIALVGACLVAIKEKMMPQNWGTVATAIFLSALVFAIVGIWPRRKMLPLDCASEIENKEKAAIRYKATWVRASFTALCIGVAMTIAGFLSSPPAK